MKKVLSLFLSLVMMLSVTAGIDFSSYAYASGDYEYTVRSNNASITKYNGNETNVIIPSTLGGYTVINIGNSAFENCTNLKNVTIPDSVTSIDNWAFSQCTSLTSITIPNSVTSIGNSTFEYCTSLTSVTIPNSVTGIGNYAFYNCTSLTSVTIPSSVTSIGDCVFEDCTSLKTVYYGGNKEEWKKIFIGDYNDCLINATIHCMDGISNKKHSHKYKTTTTKATTKKNGRIVKKCYLCDETITTTIYYPKTITLSKTSYTYNGKAQKPSVTVKDSNGKKIASSNYSVSYSSGRKNVGNYTVTIKFKGNYNGTVKKTFTINPKVTYNGNMYIGGSQALKVKSSSKKVTYSSSNKKVATVNKKGVVTAKKKGTTTITVKSNGISVKVKITVKNPGISLNKSNVSLYKGNSVTLKATTTPSGCKVTWKSSNKKVATVSENGKVKGVGKGKATITATFKYKGKTYKKTCKVTVKICKMNKSSVTIYNSYSYNGLKVIGGSGKISWSSSDKKIATVDKNGKVIGNKRGTCYIYAKRNGETVKCKVTVSYYTFECNCPDFGAFCGIQRFSDDYRNGSYYFSYRMDDITDKYYSFDAVNYYGDYLQESGYEYYDGNMTFYPNKKGQEIFIKGEPGEYGCEIVIISISEYSLIVSYSVYPY